MNIGSDITTAARSLNEHLRPTGWLQAVGIGGTDDAPVLHVYTLVKKVRGCPDTWEGFPVKQSYIGKVRAT